MPNGATETRRDEDDSRRRENPKEKKIYIHQCRLKDRKEVEKKPHSFRFNGFVTNIWLAIYSVTGFRSTYL